MNSIRIVLTDDVVCFYGQYLKHEQTEKTHSYASVDGRVFEFPKENIACVIVDTEDDVILDHHEPLCVEVRRGVDVPPLYEQIEFSGRELETECDNWRLFRCVNGQVFHFNKRVYDC